MVCEIEMVKNDDGTSSLSEDSKAKLQSQQKDTSSKITSVEDGDVDDEYYEVEKVLEVRLNKHFHSEEYKVRFKDTRLRMTCGCLALSLKNLSHSTQCRRGVDSGSTG